MVTAVILAGGAGVRMRSHGMPKQFLTLYGKPIICYTLDAFEQCGSVDQIIIPCNSGWISYMEDIVAKYHFRKMKKIVAGGKDRQGSVMEALKALEDPGPDDIVLIHDGVRPLIDAETITRCVQCVRQYGSAITVSPQTETVMIRKADGSSCRIVDRDRCLTARAPQCFYLRDILSAHRRVQTEREHRFIDSQSDAALRV